MSALGKTAIIGIDLGGTKVSAGLVQNNRIARTASRPIPSQESEERVMEEIIRAAEEVFDPAAAGIGIGVPSVVDTARGIVYNVQNIPSWKEVPLKEIMEKRFGRPVYVNNDANCFAVGEKHFGKGKKYKDLVGVTLGTGMGTGIIIDGRLYSGTNCGAGEFGSMPYKDSVLERYCSGQFFTAGFGIGGDEVHARAVRGDAEARRILEQFGTHLADAVMIIMFAVDPQSVILGGSVTRSFPFFEDSLLEKMKVFPYQRSVERLIIEISDQPQIAVLGAAALYLDARAGRNDEKD